MSFTLKGLLFGAVAALVLAVGQGSPAVAEEVQLAGGHAGAGGPHAAMIQKRVGLMRSMGRASRGGDAAGVVTAVKALQDASLWPAGSANPKNRAKAEIWANMADFMTKMKAVETAAAGGATGRDLGPNCGACHRLYRGPKPGGKGKKGKR